MSKQWFPTNLSRLSKITIVKGGAKVYHLGGGKPYHRVSARQSCRDYRWDCPLL